MPTCCAGEKIESNERLPLLASRETSRVHLKIHFVLYRKSLSAQIPRPVIARGINYVCRGARAEALGQIKKKWDAQKGATLQIILFISESRAVVPHNPFVQTFAP